MPKSAEMPWPAPLCESVRDSVYQQYISEKTVDEDPVSMFLHVCVCACMCVCVCVSVCVFACVM